MWDSAPSQRQMLPWLRGFSGGFGDVFPECASSLCNVLWSAAVADAGGKPAVPVELDLPHGCGIDAGDTITLSTAVTHSRSLPNLSSEYRQALSSGLAPAEVSWWFMRFS